MSAAARVLGARLAITALLSLAAAGCNRHATGGRDRCAQCGMFVDVSPRWQAGATARDGAALKFDTPRCLMTYLRGASGRGVREPWVTEYYTLAHVPAGDGATRFVTGSDVTGPMGRDLVPVRGDDAARRFARQHGGRRILRFREIDAAVLQAL